MASLRRWKLAYGLLLLLSVGACAPEVRKSDDGHHAWARQVVVTLFGRQPAGETEVRVIADAATLVGRRKAAEALMGSAEFSAYWSDLLVDFVRAPREDAKDLSACVGTPLRKQAPTAALANWVKTNAPTSTGAPGGGFNLADLLASSIAADDLSPFLRGYVFASASRPLEGNEITELNRREDLYNAFEATLLGRNSTCLACHNASWSMTGRQTGWNRTYSPLGYFERSLFGAHEGPTSPHRVRAVFRVREAIGAGSTPWGMSDCGNFQVPPTDDAELATGEQAFLAGEQGRRASIFTVEQLLRTGIGNLTNGLDRTVSPIDQQACAVCGSCPAGAVPPADAAQQAREDAVRTLFRTKGCLTCHASGVGGLRMRDDPSFKNQLMRIASRNGTPLPRVEPGHAENSFLVNALTGFTRPDGSTFIMPPGGSAMDSASVDIVRAWINGLPAAAGCTTCATNSPGLSCPAPWATVPGDESLAYLIAMNLSDKVWAHVTGRPLTVAHHYSRNSGQRDLLWHLTEVEFIANNWSLKKLLGFIVASDYYNRRPPEDGDGIVQPNGTKSPYEVPMFFDPWVEQDPRVSPATDPGYIAADHPAKHANAMSEAVERKPALTLLRSVGVALGWPQPTRIPSGFDYPNRDLVATLGQFLRDAVPGFRGENFSAFIEWESQVARCRKPDEFLIKTDWIDRLEIAIGDYNKANPADQVTVAQAAEIVKDWLLGDGRMSAPERTLVAQLFGRAEGDSVALVTSLNDSLRNYCGVLLETPHFKLAGLSTDGVSPQPKLRVCNEGPCTYQEICRTVVPRLNVAGGPAYVCAAQSIRTVVQPQLAKKQTKQPLALKAEPKSTVPPVGAFGRPDVAVNLSLEPSRFRLAIKPDQLQKARVAEASGVAVLDAKGNVTRLAPGITVPRDAFVISEPGARLNLTIGQATVPIQLNQQVVPAGSIAQLDRTLSGMPQLLRERFMKSVRDGAIPVAEIARPGHAISAVPIGTVESALSAAFPFGSAGEPVRPAQSAAPANDPALQKRYDAVRRMQNR